MLGRTQQKLLKEGKVEFHTHVKTSEVSEESEGSALEKKNKNKKYAYLLIYLLV